MKKAIKAINCMLVMFSMIISYVIFQTKNINNEKIINYYNYLTNYLNLASSNIKVSTKEKFIKIDKYIYKNEEHKIYSPKKGTIYKIKNDEIIIKYDGGYYGCFENLLNVNVNRFDVINTNDALAYFDEYFIFYYLYYGEKLEYEELV